MSQLTGKTLKKYHQHLNMWLQIALFKIMSGYFNTGITFDPILI